MMTTFRRVTTAIEVNGTRLRGPMSLTVTTSNDLSANTWSCVLAMALLPPAFGRQFWSRTAAIDVTLLVSVVPGQVTAPNFQSLIRGSVDDIELDAVTGELHLSGRDRAARLLESRISETFPNRTASNVAALLAKRHGLKAQVTPTTLPIGQYCDNNYADLNQHHTEWELLTALARREGFELFVEGGTLFFQPPATPVAQPYALIATTDGRGAIRTATFLDLRCRRSLLLAPDILVRIVSWNRALKQQITAEARSTKTSPANTTDTPQTYIYQVPGLNWQQARQLAGQKLDELPRHERIITWSEPGVLTLAPRTQVRLSGTGTDWDQTYIVDRVQRRISAGTGFGMEVTARGPSPQVTAVR